MYIVLNTLLLYENKLYPPKSDKLLRLGQLEEKDCILLAVMFVIDPFKSTARGDTPIKLGLLQSTETFFETHPFVLVVFGMHW